MFFTILCDLMNTSFEPSHLEALIREDYGLLEDEIRAFFTEDYRAQIEESYEGALAMAASRGAAVRDDLETWFGLSDMYRLEIAAGEGVHVAWDRRVLSPEGTYEGTYYTGIPVTFTAVVAPGWRFDHWEVDGEVYIPEEETYAGDIDGAATLTIDGGADTLDVDGGDDSLAIDGGDDLLDVDGGIATLAIDGETAAGGTCTVRAVAVREEGGCLIISEVSADGDDDWITLCNAGTTDVDLGQYCLSDDSENPQKFRLPAVSLAPGETCRINGKKNDSAGALCACTFSLSDGETLTLTPDEGIGAPGDSLRIPRMAAGCSYGRRDKGNLWCWFDRRQEP